MRLGVDWGLETYPYHSTPSESQPWTLYFATSGGYFSPVCLHVRPNLSPVAVASPPLFPCLPDLACTFLQKHHHQLLPNPFSIIKIIQRQPVLKWHQNICNHRLPVQGSFLNLFQMVLPLHNGPMLLLQPPSHPSFLPLVEHTVVGLPHPFGKLLQGEFDLLQAHWLLACCTAQVQQMVTLIICIIFDVVNIQHWKQVLNPCSIGDPWFRCWRVLFRWEAKRGSLRCPGRRLRWRIRAGRYWPIKWVAFRRSWRPARCTSG